MQQDEAAICPGPFDVLRRGEEVLHTAAQASQLDDDRIGQRLALAGIAGHSDGAAAGPAVNGQRFGAQGLARDAVLRIHHVMIRLHLAGDQGFTQAQGGVNDRLIALAAEGVGGEQHAGGYAGRHLLHDDGQGYALLVQAVAAAIADGAGRPQAAPAVDDCAEQGFVAEDVQEGVLLAGKRHFRQVFGGGR